VPQHSPLIAIVDDDISMREALEALTRSFGFSAVTFVGAAEFLRSRERLITACLITDINMPGMNGLELHRRLTDSGSAIPTIFITAYPSDAGRSRALAAGVICYLPKPFTDDNLLTCIRSALGMSNSSP
jgi:FixJ family two-component response regulator